MNENVEIVIPVFGREDVFATIGFLRTCRYAFSFHFIVVDNGNVPRLAARLAQLSADDCQVIRFPENRGGSAAYIAGVEESLRKQGDYIWLLDDDAVPNARTLPGLVEAMEQILLKDSKVASVGSAVVNEKGAIIECGADFCSLLGHAFPRKNGGRVDYSAACSLLIRKEAVRACGFWEDVFIHFDDIEWGLRVTRMGWHNYATTASSVVHPEFDPKKAGPWICYFDARNQYWLASKYGRIHVALAWIKNKMKDFRATLYGGHPECKTYRKLAWHDYRNNIRRGRVDVVQFVEGLCTRR